MGRENEGNHFIVGALVGGVIGTVAALLLAPKSGCELREDIKDSYEDILETIEDNLPFQPERNGFFESKKTWGGLAGGLLGVAAAVFLSTKQGKKFRKNIRSTYEDISEQASDYMEDGSDSIKKFMKDIKPIYRAAKRKKLARRK